MFKEGKSMNYYLAIDIGASSGRHIVGWIENGKLMTEEVFRFPNGVKKFNSHLVWDVDELFESVKAGIAEALRKYPSITSLAIDTWGVDYVLLNGDRAITPCYAYRDGRTETVVAKVHAIMPFEQLYKKTGIQFEPFNSVYQLFEDKRQGRLNDATDFLMMPEYLNFKLTGEKKHEYTNATTTGLVNAITGEYDAEIIKNLGLPEKLFGKLYAPGTIVGKLKPEVAAEVGGQVTVVLCATHDTASAVLAAPIDGQTPYISSGTWSLLGVEQDFAHTDEDSLAANYSNEGSINGGFRYQKNIMGLWMLQNARKELGNISFPELSAMARGRETTDRVNVNDNRFLAPASMLGEIDKAVGRKLGAASALRVIYESLAESYKEAIEELERNTGKTYDTLNIIGGGSRDSFLNQLTAKATGKRIITGPVEATAIGNMIMQTIAAKEVENLAAARQIIKQSFEISEVNV